jgi:hypothetical protein
MLPLLSASNKLPALSKASPLGLTPEAKMLRVPLGVNSSILPLKFGPLESETNKLPALSKASP